MSSIAPSLRFVLSWLLLAVVAGTNADSCFHHCAPQSPSTTVRRKPLRRYHKQKEGLLGTAEKAGGDEQDACRRNCRVNTILDRHPATFGKSSLDRRSFLWASPFVLMGISSPVLLETFLPPLRMHIGAAAAEEAMFAGTTGDGDRNNSKRLTNPILQSLVFERILGSGSYKTVYLVSATIPPDADNHRDNNPGSTRTFRYALAVERLRNRGDVKNAFRGVLLPELIKQGLTDSNAGDGELFETIIDWWVQPSNVREFEPGQRVFSVAAAAPVDMDKILGRTRSEPKKNFVGSRWMLSFKPVYETDFKRFIKNAPALVPVGNGNAEKPNRGKITRGDDKLPLLSVSDYWTEPVLMAFVLEILHAGTLIHERGIVHRDIKPKNIMISVVPSTTTSGGSYIKRPVIIDYGFSEVGSSLLLEAGSGQQGSATRTDVCVVRPGQLKGEVDYVLAEDLAKYRGCQRGDAYAMGKTLYEFVFGPIELQERNQDDRDVISLEGAEVQNQNFRNRLFLDATAGTESRFRLSRGAADCLLFIMRGLCGSAPSDETRALTFAEAEAILSEYVSQSSSR